MYLCVLMLTTTETKVDTTKVQRNVCISLDQHPKSTQKQIPIIRQQTSAIAESYRLSLIDEFDHNNRIKKKTYPNQSPLRSDR